MDNGGHVLIDLVVHDGVIDTLKLNDVNQATATLNPNNYGISLAVKSSLVSGALTVHYQAIDASQTGQTNSPLGLRTFVDRICQHVIRLHCDIDYQLKYSIR